MGNKKYSDYSQSTDEELVALAQNDDEYAFNVLAARFLNTRYSTSKAAYLDVEDFVQEGMFGFLNAVRTYDPAKSTSFKGYASVCMQNSINTASGKIIDDVSVDSDDTRLESLEAVEDPLKHIINSERLGEVFQACESSLSEIEKTVIFLVAGGMSYAEIGKKLGMTDKAVDNAVQRARRKLKKIT